MRPFSSAGSNSPAICLVHSPLAGPLTWRLVAEELARRGITAVVPRLANTANRDSGYWQAHVATVAETLAPVPLKGRLILAGHSGAGPLLPAIRQALGRDVAGYLFVDAAIPENGKSRLDLFESVEAARAFLQAAVDGVLPVWSEDDLRSAIPDDSLRRAFVAELRPVPLAVYEEPLPVFAGWPDAPCGYVRFGSNPAYRAAHQRARDEGWPEIRLEGGHFHMLAEPVAVADALVALVEQLRLRRGAR
jgi:hypothetical protein